jgi:hypothetical protein
MSTNEMRLIAAYLTAFAWIMGSYGGYLEGRRLIEPQPERTIYQLPGVPFKGTLGD